ncbi:MAG: family 16 glycoside hydrolase [Planctomycetota bacterium]
MKLFLSWCIVLGMTAQVIAEDATNKLTESEQRSGWKMLFDGETTDGWRNYKKSEVSDGWKIIDGALTRAGRGAGDIITDKKYDSFELSLEYKISKGGNSGVMFHVEETNGPPWHTGPEIQVQDNVDGHDPQLAGWLYQLFQPSMDRSTRKPIDATRPAGEWNQLYIRIKPGDSEVCMNGVRYYRFNVGNPNWLKKVAQSKFSKFPGFGKAGSGHICLQDHGNEVAYRNIKIREIGSDGQVPQPIDGSLNLTGKLAFPKLKWEQWEPFDDAGKQRKLRLMELTYANDDSNRLFAASQYGVIWTFENRSDVEKSNVFLDLRKQVYHWAKPGANEQGLLGLAMHPNFKDNGLFYVYYSHIDNRRSIVSQFRVSKSDPNKADPNSEVVLMEIKQPFQNHNGGAIEFGPDGFLYIALGDGGFRNDPYSNSQNLSTLLGSILRIDVDNPSNGRNYGIPSDNPFVDRTGARPEIYAYGLRNPWRIAFDKETGNLWVGDVGQELWEEITLIEKGGNYGWSIREGFHPFGSTVATDSVKTLDPVWEYDHQIGKSITGGRVYRSTRVPELNGKYLYADYVSGSVWALTYDDKAGWVTKNERVVPDYIAVLSFGQDQNGEVFYLTESARGESIYRFDKP